MKRVYICMGIFALLIAFSLFDGHYIRESVGEVRGLVDSAADSYGAGDYEKAKRLIDEALVKWGEFGGKEFLLADRAHVGEITALLCRLKSLNGDMFMAECAYTSAVIARVISES